MVKRAFVTGIAGQDGSYLADRLVADGLEVHALVLRADGPPEHCPPDVVLHPGDVTDVDGVRALLLDVDPHEVYNLAAISSVAQSWSEPDLTARVNGLGAVGLLESALAVQERHGHAVAFVQASSAEMFGEPSVSPQDESTPIRPVNPYGAAKAYAHLAVGVYRRRDLHAVGAILYNHESPRRPDRFVTRRITATVAAIARGRADRLVLGNLDSRRDWGWAPDYVDALVRCRPRRPGRRLRHRHRRRPQRPRVRRRRLRPRRHRRLGAPSRERPRPRPPRRRHRPHRRRLEGPPRPRLDAHRRLRGGRRPDGRRRPRAAGLTGHPAG